MLLGSRERKRAKLFSDKTPLGLFISWFPVIQSGHARLHVFVGSIDKATGKPQVFVFFNSKAFP